ncbi:protein slit-like [Physella acuta]|uniref:protein slit-like n=1 Tax=Physella acuta TaxID=109671 RepID=UPI0027DC3A9E|nr:protein slit-like [Physella acuta]
MASSTCISLLCVVVLLSPVTVVNSQDCSDVFPRCQCYEGPVVDCSSRGLTALPSLTAPFTTLIQEMRLNNNSFTALGSDAFHGLRIKGIDLRGNPIGSVHSNAFQGLVVDLTILYLDGNKTSVVPIDALKVLVNLEELVLRNYGILHLLNTDSYFVSFPKLKYLTLDNWGLTSIDDDPFHGPTELLNLIISNQNIVGLPVDVLHSPALSKLKKLTFSNCHNVGKVTQSAFANLAAIQEIDLSYNFIHTLDNDCFKGIGDTLIKLNLSGNTLIPSNSLTLAGLKDLTVLKELDMSHNENLQTLPNLSQLGNQQSLKLYLNNNKISTLGAKSVAAIATTLQTLNLSMNQIHSIHVNAFDGITTLQVLDLSKQDIGTQEILTVPHLSNLSSTLKELYLSGQTVNPDTLWSAITDLTQLTVLSLSATKLSTIPSFALEELAALIQLDISSNRISSLTPDMLVGPRNSLKVLNIAGNPITTLPSCLFNGYTSFPLNIILDSPLQCNCAIRWLWERLKNNTIVFPTAAKCADNMPLSNKTLTDFCPGPYTEPACTDNYLTPTLTIRLGAGERNITLNWTLSDNKDLLNYMLQLESESGAVTNVNRSNSQPYVFTNLTPNTVHHVCVYAVFLKRHTIVECDNIKTLQDTTGAAGQQNGLTSQEVGIIVGAVIGGVILLAIIIAIVVLVFIRKVPKKAEAPSHPEQPRIFSKSELPSMGRETHTFVRGKKREGEPEHKEGMKVVAISDGQTGGRVGRAQILYSDSSAKHGSTSSSNQSFYENDRRGVLPEPPRAKPEAYYNMGFKGDHYNEIDTGPRSPEKLKQNDLNNKKSAPGARPPSYIELNRPKGQTGPASPSLHIQGVDNMGFQHDDTKPRLSTSREVTV